MRFFVIFTIFCVALAAHAIAQENEDSDFDAFSDFDDEFDAKEVTPQKKDSNPSNAGGGGGKAGGANIPPQQQQEEDDDEDDGIVEIEANEFEGFDDEEFENWNADQMDEIEKKTEVPKKNQQEPKLTVAKVPLHYHFRAHWDMYALELLALAGLFVYFCNYFIGRSKNSKIANLWLSTHRQLLEENFTLVGDDGRKEGESSSSTTFIKESESLYTLWCSGRTCCEGMLVELKMMKRQDLVSIIAGFMRPVMDQLQIRVEISKDCMDSFVFCLATRKTATRMFKEMSDLSKFCTLVQKPQEKYNVPNGYSILSEIPEATAHMCDSKLLASLNKYASIIESVHISDQYTGIIPQEDPNQAKQPDVQRVLIATFNILPKSNMEEMKTMLQLVFYMMDRLKRFRLSREGKNKAEKNRSRVAEEFRKLNNTARAEAAQQKKEEQRKAEKEKILAEEDPEKQRRWEKKEQKRQAKKNQPKMKQMSIKAM